MEDRLCQSAQRQELMVGYQYPQAPSHSYGEAIDLARQGADIAELQEKCRVSNVEAELTVLLHGSSR